MNAKDFKILVDFLHNKYSIWNKIVKSETWLNENYMPSSQTWIIHHINLQNI